MSSRCDGTNQGFISTILPQPSDVQKRLDRFLNERLPDKSRTQIQKMIEGHNILVEGKPAKTSYKIRGGEKIQMFRVEQPDPSLAPEPIALEIVYEDEDLAVINKPAGMVVHSGAGVNSGTLVNALLYHFKELSKWGGNDRPGIVHRLDKQTSGLIVVAKNDFCHQRLSRQFQSREVIKKYIALVHGNLEKTSGEINKPIGRDRLHRVKMTTRGVRPREAHTNYQVLEKFPKFTLIELCIKTGRTHQIRVHLSSIRHPVVGDTLYGAPARMSLHRNATWLPTLNRNFLHAALLEFFHPRTQLPVGFSVGLPEELRLFLSRLRQSSPPTSNDGVMP